MGGPSGTSSVSDSADDRHVKRVILSRRFPGVVRDHLYVVRVVADTADAPLDRSAARTSADSAAKLRVARPAGRGDDELPCHGTSEVENVLPWAWLGGRRDAA